MLAVKGFSKALTVTFCHKTKSPAGVGGALSCLGRLLVSGYGFAFDEFKSAVSELIEIEAGDSFDFGVC